MPLLCVLWWEMRFNTKNILQCTGTLVIKVSKGGLIIHHGKLVSKLYYDGDFSLTQLPVAPFTNMV